MGKLLLFHTEMISAFIPLGKCVSWGELQMDAKIQILNFSYIYMKSGSMQVLKKRVWYLWNHIFTGAMRQA